jgi:type II secretory pathway component PulK
MMIRIRNFRHKPDGGSVMVSILVITLFLSVFVTALIVYAGANLSRARGRVLLLEAQYAAESGADAAIAILIVIQIQHTREQGRHRQQFLPTQSIKLPFRQPLPM